MFKSTYGLCKTWAEPMEKTRTVSRITQQLSAPAKNSPIGLWQTTRLSAHKLYSFSLPFSAWFLSKITGVHTGLYTFSTALIIRSYKDTFIHFLFNTWKAPGGQVA